MNRYAGWALAVMQDKYLICKAIMYKIRTRGSGRKGVKRKYYRKKSLYQMEWKYPNWDLAHGLFRMIRLRRRFARRHP